MTHMKRDATYISPACACHEWITSCSNIWETGYCLDRDMCPSSHLHVIEYLPVVRTCLAVQEAVTFEAAVPINSDLSFLVLRRFLESSLPRTSTLVSCIENAGPESRWFVNALIDTNVAVGVRAHGADRSVKGSCTGHLHLTCR